MQIRMKVPDISCGHCVAAVKGALGGVAGVSSVDVSLDTKIVEVAAEAGVEPEMLLAAVRSAGYTPEILG